MSRQASGLRAWVWQRATAIYIALFLIYVVVHFALAAPVQYQSLREWLARPVVSVATLLFVGSVLIHAWVGMRDIAIDYIKPLPIRLALLGGVILVLAGSGLWILRSIAAL
ncbi:MAG: succinate dehydrogenase, hydrophobic membrane anchor protein [Chromatiales bacterium]|nr:succinate dehydrogenase, hydrophobic membrane anchor protein [Chromatiales bacterium]